LRRRGQLRDGGAYGCAVPIGPTPNSIRACYQGSRIRGVPRT